MPNSLTKAIVSNKWCLLISLWLTDPNILIVWKQGGEETLKKEEDKNA